jgi:hypothetical protein
MFSVCAGLIFAVGTHAQSSLLVVGYRSDNVVRFDLEISKFKQRFHHLETIHSK